MIDLHCHLLPGVDDGPATTAEAVALARGMAQAGVRTAVATPHVSADHPNGPERIAVAAAALATALAREGVDLDVRVGAEIELGCLARLDDGALAALGLGGGPALLVECPYGPLPPGLDEVLRDLRERGHQPVLAHPERSPGFQRDPKRLAAAVRAGALCSITAGSLAGRFGRTVRASALGMLREGLVHDVASDAHDLRRRPPGLREEIAAAEDRLPGVAALTEWLTEIAPAAILAGAPPPSRPALPRARAGRLRGLRARRASRR